MSDSTPHIERTPFDRLDPPKQIRVAFCPACGRRIVGNYNLEPARKKCTKTWHLTTAVEHTYKLSAKETE